jgi:hypothetical protein
MPIPNLHHAVMVTIQAVNKASTAFDRDTREPLRTVARTAVRLPAMNRVRALQEPQYIPVGLDEDVEGWLVVRLLDCNARDYTPKIGDRITAIGHRAVEFYVRMIQDEGHHTDTGGATIMRLYYEDRRPSAKAPRLN